MSDKSRINKQPTAAAEAKKTGADPFARAGNVKRRGEEPSPDDRARGERSGRETAGEADSGRR